LGLRRTTSVSVILNFYYDLCLGKLMRKWVTIFATVLFIVGAGHSQPCTMPGQTPSTAFEVCGTSTFYQSTIPACKNNYLFVPGCSSRDNFVDYADRNPFWYRFTCSTLRVRKFFKRERQC